MKKKLSILSGTFEIGCGIMVKDETHNFYHLLVVEDRETKKACIELHDKVYFEEDIQK